MPDAVIGLLGFIKVHLPALFGAIFSGKAVAKNDFTVLAWIFYWIVTNIAGIIFVVILSVYLGEYVIQNRQLNTIEADVMRLMMGVFGLKIIRYVNVKMEPFFNDVVDMLIDAMRSRLGLKDRSKEDDK